MLFDHGELMSMLVQGETVLNMLSKQPYGRNVYNLLIFHGAMHACKHVDMVRLCQCCLGHRKYVIT